MVVLRLKNEVSDQPVAYVERGKCSYCRILEVSWEVWNFDVHKVELQELRTSRGEICESVSSISGPEKC